MEEPTAGGIEVGRIAHLGPREMEVVVQEELHLSAHLVMIRNAEMP
jgi:hypothetical protein